MFSAEELQEINQLILQIARRMARQYSRRKERARSANMLDLRTTMRLPAREPDAEYMNVVVRHDGELFAFMVDDVGDVVTVDHEAVEATPATIDERWRSASAGIVRRDHDLLVVMKVPELLRLEQVVS